MIEGVIIKQINKFVDERGWLGEAWRNDESDFRPAMAYISLTKPGVVRGPHEHKFQSDSFVFVGPGNFEIYLWDNREGSPTKGQQLKLEVGENNPVLIIVPPGVVHGYKCLGDEAAYSLNLPDKLYRGQGKNDEPDEIRWEKDPDSPFKIN